MLKNERGPGFLDLFRPCRVIQPGVSGFPLFLRQAFTIRQDGGDFGFYFVIIVFHRFAPLDYSWSWPS